MRVLSGHDRVSGCMTGHVILPEAVGRVKDSLVGHSDGEDGKDQEPEPRISLDHSSLFSWLLLSTVALVLLAVVVVAAAVVDGGGSVAIVGQRLWFIVYYIVLQAPTMLK